MAPGFRNPPLDELPVYDGGPVDCGRISLCCWNRTPDGNFQIQFGLSRESDTDAHQYFPDNRLRAIFGCARWAPGQLEDELRRNTWVATSRTDPNLMLEKDGDELWRAFLTKCSPLLGLSANAPDNPADN